jgi:tripartite-type tricarboxylate transporter receptor subunit TctC
LNYGTSGAGTTVHLSAELFSVMTGIRMVHVPYKGAAEALASLLGGQTDLMFASLSSSIPFIKAGKLRAFAVTGAQRSPSIPELPTVAEAANLPGYAASAWFGIVGPAGMPKAVVAKLNKAAFSTLDDAEVRKRLFNAGVEIRTSTPEEFARYIESEMRKWASVVKASGARAD